MVNREIFGVFTKGTHVGSTTQGYEPSNVMAIARDSDQIAVSYFDISTSSCVLGQFQDDIAYSALRTLLSQIRPVEIIHEKDSLPPDLHKMLKGQPC